MPETKLEVRVPFLTIEFTDFHKNLCRIRANFENRGNAITVAGSL